MRIKKASVLNSLGKDNANEAEEGEVVRVDGTQPVELIRGRTTRRRLEECKVWVEDRLGEDPGKAIKKKKECEHAEQRKRTRSRRDHAREPFAGDTTGIDTFLIPEATAELAILNLLGGPALELGERIHKDEVAANVNLERATDIAVRLLFERLREVEPLDVEREDLGVLDEERERARHERWVVANELVQRLLVLGRELDKDVVCRELLDLGRGRSRRLALARDGLLDSSGLFAASRVFTDLPFREKTDDASETAAKTREREERGQLTTMSDSTTGRRTVATSSSSVLSSTVVRTELSFCQSEENEKLS